MYYAVTSRKERVLLLLISTAAFVTANVPIGIKSEESISATLRDAAELLEKGKVHDNSVLSATCVDDLSQRMDLLSESMLDIESLTERISEKESNINSILHAVNNRQMENLVRRLESTLEREIKLRELESDAKKMQQELLQKNLSKKSQSYDSAATDHVLEITSTQLAERLDLDVIMENSEEVIRMWTLNLIEEELGLYKKEIFDLVHQVDISHDDSHNSKTTECPSLAKFVQKVQQALNDNTEDDISKVDHAQGASIIHWLTSETYSLSGIFSGTLGSVWWNKFIPQDWERLFPYGWEKWEVGVPSYIYHSLSFLRGDMAPPEAILQKNTLPGSCWPMEGRSGQITLKLAYPVVIEAVSIDHISSNIIPEGTYNSAPKHLSIIGYHSCDEMDENCGAVGFQLSNPIDIADIVYDLEGPSVQTFESHYAKAIANIPTPSFDADDKLSGSCSVEASCSRPPRVSVAAIEVKVLENWGNPDFTCLYRLRVHGDPEN
jgi:SUN domain-containing protein 1/2